MDQQYTQQTHVAGQQQYTQQQQTPQNQYNQQPQQQGQQPQYASPAGAMPVDDDDLAFDGVIENDGNEFVLIPAGVYPFNVIDFEQTEYQDTKANKSRKKIIVHVQVTLPDGSTAVIKDHLPLKRTLEWKFCQLFTSVGDRKSGEPLQMKWNEIRGKGGQVKIKVDSFNKKGTNEQLQNNKVDKYLDPSKATAPAAGQQLQQPSFQQPVQQPVQQTIAGTPPAPTGQASQAGWGGNFS